MKIGLVADSHDNVPSVIRMIEVFKKTEVDSVIHAEDFVVTFTLNKFLHQDWPFYGVFGNNDGEKNGILKFAPQIATGPFELELGGIKVGVVHDRHDWDDRECDLLVFGHTHQCFYKEIDGRIEINPGELGGWLYGKSTVAVYDTETKDAEIIEV